MKRVFIIFVLFALGLSTIYLLNQSVDEQSNYTTPSNSSPQQDTSGIVTSDDISNGYKARQLAFEALDPAYPDAPITYEFNGESVTPAFDVADEFLWDTVKQLAPNETITNAISELEVTFDQEDPTDAYVESIDDTNASWRLGINYIAADSFDVLGETLVHELAHIISLQDAQTTTETEDADILTNCATYLVAEGCTTETSYLNQFFDKFWKDSGDFIDRDRTDEETSTHYENNRDRFVTDYATTNPVEDFAESFMFYIARDELEEGTVMQQKQLFFDNFPELQTYRANVRSVIAGWSLNDS